MAFDDGTTPRLAALMRMVLGATTDGEHLAALAAFRRAMGAAGLDLHDIVSRFEKGKPASSSDTPFSDVSSGWGSDSSIPHNVFDRLCQQVDTYTDDLWPRLAQWLRDQDEAWHGAHRVWLLNSQQRAFVDEQCGTAPMIRPSRRQAAWLIALFDKVTYQLARPNPPTPAPMPSPGPDTKIGAGDRTYRQRTLPSRRPKPQPRRLINRQDQHDWLKAVISARRLGPGPFWDAQLPALFSDAEVRLLAWLSTVSSWVIERPNKENVLVTQAGSAAAMAAAAHLSLRTARRAFAKALAAGYLTIERRGSGRGKPTVYNLTLPPPRWRHDGIIPLQPRRQAHRGARQGAAGAKLYDLIATNGLNGVA